MVVLLVYVDDLIIIGNDEAGISQVKESLARQFVMKDLGQFRYFLGIEPEAEMRLFSLSASMCWMFFRRHAYWGPS